jgi:lysozyme
VTLRNPPAPPRTSPTQRGVLAALIGGVATAVLFVTIPEDEGTRYKAYRDIVGVWTICQGDTKNVTPGMVETREGCEKRLEAQLIAHAAPVMKCTPWLAGEGRDYPRAAAVSAAYNFGTAAYCASSIDRRFDAGDWRGGCDALLLYNRATGSAAWAAKQKRAGESCTPSKTRRGMWSCTVKGLRLRRERERALCLTGAPK